MTHKMRLNEAPFHKIKSGEKTIELRLYDEKRRLMSEGDIIEFTNVQNPNEVLKCEIVKLHIFDSFYELYATLPLTKCGYTEENAGQAKADDMNEYYPVEEQNKYGALGIEIKLI